MSMDLRALLEGWIDVAPAAAREVTGLALDSRAVRPGDLFVALKGTRADGHAFIADAVARGACAVLAEVRTEVSPSVPLWVLPDLRWRLGAIADRFFGAPSRALGVIGVTGTNGKTTCTQLLAQALDAPNARCGVIGTLGSGFPAALDPGAHTTPDAVSVHARLAQFRTRGARYCAMEVSSHALAQGRVGGVRFRSAVFTNLTRDHLDYHGDMERYGAAKARLFETPGLVTAVINLDDPFGRALHANLPPGVRAIGFGFDAGEVRATGLRAHADGLEMDVRAPQGEVRVRSPLLGRFNASNLLAALAVLVDLGVSLEAAAAALARAQPPRGRMQRVQRPGRPLVVIDYAHTPDALEKVLEALRAHARGRLICVFGCGGDRDRGKRPLMGAAAERGADVVIVTDDNPRTEDPGRIVEDILAGMRARPRVVRDRARAIESAVAAARPEDIVLVAGKGHEDYQEVAGRRHPFSDAEAARRALEAA